MLFHRSFFLEYVIEIDSDHAMDPVTSRESESTDVCPYPSLHFKSEQSAVNEANMDMRIPPHRPVTGRQIKNVAQNFKFRNMSKVVASVKLHS